MKVLVSAHELVFPAVLSHRLPPGRRLPASNREGPAMMLFFALAAAISSGLAVWHAASGNATLAAIDTVSAVFNLLMFVHSTIDEAST